MSIHLSSSSRSGFSILVALGTIGVLLIIVIGIATLYVGEMRLSRAQYDSIYSYAQAEGAFEYGMLKVKNHREGFEDSMSSSDPDGNMLSGSTERTRNTDTSYTIRASSRSADFTIEANSHLILPLFVGESSPLVGSSTSKNPSLKIGVTQATSLTFGSSSPSSISWSIVAMSGSENVSLAGTGEINSTTIGTMRLRGEECFDSEGSKINCELRGAGGESLFYFYDLTGSVNSFLAGTDSFAGMRISDPYLMIFNNFTGNATIAELAAQAVNNATNIALGVNASLNPGDSTITISTDLPFALPTLEVIAESKKGNSLKSIRFTEDKSRYYDALKYGVYNTD